MVYKKRGPTASRRSKEWYNKTYSAGDVAAKAWEGVKLLKGIINSELKEVTYTNTSKFSTAGSVALISGITQGDSESGREGNSVLVKSLQCRFNPVWDTVMGPSLNRIIIFRDKQQVNDGNPTISDLLESDVLGRIDHLHEKRFAILWDKTFQLDSNRRQQIALKNIHMNQHVLFNGASSTDVQKNHIYVAQISNVGSSTMGSSLNMDIKMNYYDN